MRWPKVQQKLCDDDDVYLQVSSLNIYKTSIIFNCRLSDFRPETYYLSGRRSL